MAQTNLEVVISAQDRFTGTANRVIGTLGRMDTAAGRVGKGVGQLGLGLARLAVVGAAAAGTGLVAVTRAGLSFQDAMAGVSKTVEGSKADIAALGQDLLKLSTTIPVSANELAGIAQEAGALGVARGDIANFTKVVAELSAATVGLTTDAAAEAFGKLGNVLQIHGPDIERFGSSLVALGNAGASSEGDIIQVATRFGAAGSQAKLSAAQVLGFSSAIASLGVEPEAAGSSLSRLFNNITKYIGTGNKRIDAFAKTAGMSVKDFSKFFAQDASGAVQLFLKNLGKMDRFAASNVLKNAGINNVRDINAVLLLSQNYGELARQVNLSEQAFKDNTELADTAAKRFDSVKAKLEILKNTLFLGAVTMSNEFLPALGRTIGKLTDFLKLPSTQDSLKNLGREIASTLDSIDWNRVGAAAQTFVDVLKTAYDLVSKIPVEVDAAVVAFMGLNRLSGGLIGSGISNIVGGLAQSGLRGIASKIPVVGSAFATPVYVTNWPLGGLGGGLGGVGGGGLAAAAGGLGAAGLGTLAVGIGGILGAYYLPEILKGPEGTTDRTPQNPIAYAYGQIGVNGLGADAKTRSRMTGDALTSIAPVIASSHNAYVAAQNAAMQSHNAYVAGESASRGAATASHNAYVAATRKIPAPQTTVKINQSVKVTVSARDVDTAASFKNTYESAQAANRWAASRT